MFRELKWVYLGELVHKVVRYVVVLEGGLSIPPRELGLVLVVARDGTYEPSLDAMKCTLLPRCVWV